MKKSNYNFFYEVQDGILAYNARTNAMAVVEKEKYEKLRRILSGELCEDKEFIDELTYGGFIVENHVDEFQVLRHDMYMNRFSNNALSLTIAPTSDCNFRCSYCYEKNVLHAQSMSDDVADKLVEFVKRKAASIGKLDVTWYGGEPLLEYRRILDLSQKFMKICNEHEVQYNANIVTNGYLLTADKLKKLIECKVTTIQITLDGTKEVHDNRRYLKNHGDTFERIILNLLSFKRLVETEERFPSIAIRMNIDRSNIEEAHKLLDYINSLPLRRYVVPYVAGVYDASDIEHILTLTDSEYWELKKGYLNKFAEKGFRVDVQAYYPNRITSNCCCDRIDSVVIDAYGKIYKCWEEIGFEEACIGQLGINEQYNFPQCYYDYMLYDPTLDEECRKCEILPVCMGGGCPIRRVRDHRHNCQHEKKVFYENIRASAKMLGQSIKTELR